MDAMLSAITSSLWFKLRVLHSDNHQLDQPRLQGADGTRHITDHSGSGTLKIGPKDD